MHSTVATLQALGILAVFGAIGWLLHKRGFFGPGVSAAVSALSLDVALPCLVFSSLLDGFRPSAFSGWWNLPVSWAVFTVTSAAFSVAAARLAGTRFPREFRLCLFYQNAIFIPVALVTAMYGASSRETVALLLFSALFPAFFFSSYSFFFSGARGALNWKRVLHPVMFATVSAVLLATAGVQSAVPGFVRSAIRQAGGMSIPLLLIMLGGRVREDFGRRGSLHLREVMVFVGVKNVVFPAAAVLAISLLPVSRELALIVVFQAAMPPVTAVPVVVERAGGNADIANQFMLASLAVAPLTIPAALLWFEALWAR
jgi:predicted permease